MMAFQNGSKVTITDNSVTPPSVTEAYVQRITATEVIVGFGKGFRRFKKKSGVAIGYRHLSVKPFSNSLSENT